MKTVADTFDVSRSNLIERLKGVRVRAASYGKQDDEWLLPIIHDLEDVSRSGRRRRHRIERPFDVASGAVDRTVTQLVAAVAAKANDATDRIERGLIASRVHVARRRQSGLDWSSDRDCDEKKATDHRAGFDSRLRQTAVARGAVLGTRAAVATVSVGRRSGRSHRSPRRERVRESDPRADQKRQRSSSRSPRGRRWR